MATGFDYEPKLVLRKYSLCTKAMIKADISAIMSSSYKEWIGLFQLLPEWICPLLRQILEAMRIVISVNWRKSKTAYGGLYKNQSIGRGFPRLVDWLYSRNKSYRKSR